MSPIRYIFSYSHSTLKRFIGNGVAHWATSGSLGHSTGTGTVMTVQAQVIYVQSAGYVLFSAVRTFSAAGEYGRYGTFYPFDILL